MYATDASAPVLSDLQLPNVEEPGGVSAAAIRVGDTNGQVISINAADDTAVAAVHFYLTHIADNTTVFLGTDETGVAEATGARFAVPFNIFDFADGAWELKVVAIDRFGSESTLRQSIAISMAAPAAPIMDQPIDGSGFAQGQLTISGRARTDASVEVQARRVDASGNPLASDDGIFTTLGSAAAVNSAGQFSWPILLRIP